MTDDTDYTEKDMSPALQSAIQQIQAQAQRQIQETLQKQRDHLGLPEDARFDLENAVWIMPSEGDE